MFVTKACKQLFLYSFRTWCYWSWRSLRENIDPFVGIACEREREMRCEDYVVCACVQKVKCKLLLDIEVGFHEFVLLSIF